MKNIFVIIIYGYIYTYYSNYKMFIKIYCNRNQKLIINRKSINYTVTVIRNRTVTYRNLP